MPACIISGALVAATERSYRGNPERGIQAGISRRVWIVEAFDAPPVMVRFRQDQAAEFKTISQAGPGGQVSVQCSMYTPDGKPTEYTVERVNEPLAGRKAAAA